MNLKVLLKHKKSGKLFFFDKMWIVSNSLCIELAEHHHDQFNLFSGMCGLPSHDINEYNVEVIGASNES